MFHRPACDAGAARVRHALSGLFGWWRLRWRSFAALQSCTRRVHLLPTAKQSWPQNRLRAVSPTALVTRSSSAESPTSTPRAKPRQGARPGISPLSKPPDRATAVHLCVTGHAPGYSFVDDCAEMIDDALHDMHHVETMTTKIFASQQGTTIGALIGNARYSNDPRRPRARLLPQRTFSGEGSQTAIRGLARARPSFTHHTSRRNRSDGSLTEAILAASPILSAGNPGRLLGEVEPGRRGWSGMVAPTMYGELLRPIYHPGVDELPAQITRISPSNHAPSRRSRRRAPLFPPPGGRVQLASVRIRSAPLCPGHHP